MSHELNEKWNEFIKEESYAHPDDLFFEQEDDWTELDTQTVGTWRWGTIQESIYKNEKTGELVGVQFMDGSGDSEVDSYGRHAQFYPVQRMEVTVVKYIRTES